MQERSAAAYVAEFLGTFALVFAIAMSISVASGLQDFDWAVLGLVDAFVLTMIIHTLGGTSGAHVNPAITLALASLRKIGPRDMVGYWIAQLAGAVSGALVCRMVLPKDGKAVDYGATVLSEHFLNGSALRGVVAEAIATFFLMWAVMGMLVNPRGPRGWAPFVIGATLGLWIFILGPVTGAGLNPARSFGPALVSGEWADFWVYIVGPCVGALAAAVVYTVLVLRPQDRVGERPIDHLA